MASLPFAKTIEGLLAREGITPRSDIKEWTEELGEEGDEVWNLLNHGFPGLAGIDLSGSIGMELPGQRAVSSKDIAGILGEAAIDIFGVPTGIVEDTFRAAEQLYHGDISRAIEEGPFTPQVIANYMAGARMEKEGVTTPKGETIRDDLGEQIQLTSGEAAKKKFLGFQPTKLSEGWRTFQARKAETARWEKEKDKLRVAFKKAATKGNYEKLAEIGVKIVFLTAELPPYITPIDTNELWREILPIVPPSGREFLLRQEIR